MGWRLPTHPLIELILRQAMIRRLNPLVGPLPDVVLRTFSLRGQLEYIRAEILLRAMGTKTAAAIERVRRGVAGGAASHARDESRFVEAPLSVPVDLKTGVYGFALDQQGKLDTAEAELRRLRRAADRLWRRRRHGRVS